MKVRIESLYNPRIKELRRLKEKKYRSQSGVFLIEGSRFVREALRQNAVLTAVIAVGEEHLEGLELPPETDILMVSKEILAELSGTVTPQGIMAAVKIPAGDETAFQKEQGIWLYLDEIRDPGNLGTIIRSAHAFALDGLILAKGCADPYQDKVLRSTMGSIFCVPLLLDKDPGYLEERIRQGAILYLADLTDASPLPEVRPARQTIIVIGSEAQGVSDMVRDLPHQSIRIPMPGQAESLNAAVAASLVMYEFNGRQ